MVKSTRLQKGFTLIEVVVVAGIVGLVAATIIPNFGKMNSRFATELLAHDIALAIRGAQADALNGKTFAGGPQKSFGISATSLVGSNKQILEFHDVGTPTGSGAYEAGTDGLVSTSAFQNLTTISGVCRKLSGVGQAMTCSAITRLDIVFTRPDPDAKMEGNGGGNPENNYAEAGILLRSPDGTLEKCVHVYATGQVHVTTGAGDGTTCP